MFLFSVYLVSYGIIFINLISDINSRTYHLFKLICGSDIDIILNHAKKYCNKGIWIYIRVYTSSLNISLFCMMSLLYQIANFIDIDMYRCVFLWTKFKVRASSWGYAGFCDGAFSIGIGNGGSFVSTVYLGTVVRVIQFVSGV